VARVSFICTANRARSPFAAALLRRQIHGVSVEVDSFGVLEQGGAPALPGAVRAAAAFGIDLSDHRARSLGPGELMGADLAIGFERAHVAAAVSTGGVSADRAFLLAELADVLELDVLPWPANSEDLVARIAHADARRFARGRLPRSIADPVGSSDRRFQQTYEEIDRLVATVAMRLFSSGGAWTG
jgi:protein-tyrosine phosphatase